MTDNQEAPMKLPTTHPYLATLTIDPADWHRFEQMAEDRPEMKIRNTDKSGPDRWTVHVACASETVRDLLEAAW